MSARPLHLAAIFAITATPLAAQTDCRFHLGNDTLLCAGEVIMLHAPAGALDWTWGNGMDPLMISTDTTGWYICTATFLGNAGSVVVNGDLSQGDTGFTTDLLPGPGGTWGPLSQEGTYLVALNGTEAHDNFADCADHTGAGPMLVVNGSATANANVWCQTVTVQPQTPYAFSAWVASMVDEAPAILDFAVNGVSLGAPLLASTTTCQWEQFHALWSSGASTSATICITNQNLAQGGNDFALDDISFAPMCIHTDSMYVERLPPAPTFDIGPDTLLCPGSAIELTAMMDLGDWPFNDVTFTWNDGSTGPTLLVASPGTYSVTANGRCMHMDGSVIIEPDTCGGFLHMPNVFSPNQDGVNDQFRPIVTGRVDRFDMEVHNRWGQKVFSTRSAGSGWNGRVEGGRAPSGTYYWTARYAVRNEDGTLSEHEESGHVTLLGD